MQVRANYANVEPVLVEVVEGSSELVELFLRDALGVPGEDLVLNLINGTVDGGQQLLPPDAQSLHRVLSVSETSNAWLMHT